MRSIYCWHCQANGARRVRRAAARVAGQSRDRMWMGALAYLCAPHALDFLHERIVTDLRRD